MKIIIKGTTKEIADFVLELQSRQKNDSPLRTIKKAMQESLCSSIDCENICPDIERMNNSVMLKKELNLTVDNTNKNIPYITRIWDNPQYKNCEKISEMQLMNIVDYISNHANSCCVKNGKMKYFPNVSLLELAKILGMDI